MKSFLLGIVVAELVALPIGCNPFGPDQSVVLGVSSLDAPATISAGSPLTVVLTVTTGGCKSFDRMVAVRGASGASLTVYGRDASKGRTDIMCPQDLRSEQHSYSFDPPFQSEFTVQVDRGRLSPLSATVDVQ